MEAQRLSTTRTVRSGNASSSSLAAMTADWYVVERAEEKHRHKMSFPASRMGRMAASNSPTLTAEVTGMAPPRTRS